jgi:hypothetical protein
VAVFAAGGAALGIAVVLAMFSPSRGPEQATGAQTAEVHPSQTPVAPTATASAATTVTAAPSAAPSASTDPSNSPVPELSVEDLPAATGSTAAPPAASTAPPKPRGAPHASHEYGF